MQSVIVVPSSNPFISKKRKEQDTKGAVEHFPIGYSANDRPSWDSFVECVCGEWSGTYSNLLRKHVKWGEKQQKLRSRDVIKPSILDDGNRKSEVHTPMLSVQCADGVDSTDLATTEESNSRALSSTEVTTTFICPYCSSCVNRPASSQGHNGSNQKEQ
jgi:hypothetical protein